MPGFVRIEGNHQTVGIKLGRYWGNYFGALKIKGKTGYHRRIHDKYSEWLKPSRDKEAFENRKAIMHKVENGFEEIWKEIKGIHEGLMETDYGRGVTLDSLFACILAEADKHSCSTAILSSDTGYTMMHSDEYEADNTAVS